MDLDKQIQDITNKINAIGKKLEKIENNKKEDKEPIGMISLIDGYINIELLLDEKLFDEEKMEKLQDIANQLQDLMLEVQKGVEK